MARPIKLYGGGNTPNLVKVAILLEELGLSYEATGPMDWKSELYTSINPNGRAPSIEDPNTGVTLFEVHASSCGGNAGTDKGNSLALSLSILWRHMTRKKDFNARHP